MTTPTVTPAAQPAAATTPVQIGLTPMDLSWQGDDGRHQSISAGAKVAWGPLDGTFVAKRDESKTQSMMTGGDFSAIKLEPGPAGIMTHIKRAGGRFDYEKLLDPLGNDGRVKGVTEWINLEYVQTKSTKGALTAGLFGLTAGIEASANQTITGLKGLHVTRQQDNQLKVRLEDGYAVSQQGGVTVELLGFKNKPGTEMRVLKEGIEITFDSSNQGKAALTTLRNTGELPKDINPKTGLPIGVTRYVTTVDYESIQRDGDKHTLSKTHHPLTQTTSLVETFQPKDGWPKLTIERKFVGKPDAQSEVFEARRYTFEFKVGNAADLKALQTLDLTGIGVDQKALASIKPPSILKLQLDEQQVSALMKTAALAEKNNGRPYDGVGYNADALMASNIKPTDKTLTFAQLVMEAKPYDGSASITDVRTQYGTGQLAGASALGLLALTTDAAYIKGASGRENPLMDGRVVPVAVDSATTSAMPVPESAGPALRR